MGALNKKHGSNLPMLPVDQNGGMLVEVDSKQESQTALTIVS